LEKFLFPRNMHYNFVNKLSGGERRRLKLMTILMSNPNYLILDEPTNDLDIFVMSVLEEYLRSFEGCLIVVSHDRYFMDKMVDHLFVFEGDGEVKDIIGNYTEYRKLKADQKKEDKDSPVLKEEKLIKIQEDKPKKKLSFKEKSEFESVEKELEDLETEKETLTQKLSDPEVHGEEMMKIGTRLSEVVSAIESKTDRWLELSEYA
jgi:ATP-binding cassette subfamily F protein uup